jgi:protein O-GlcNAc transferase
MLDMKATLIFGGHGSKTSGLIERGRWFFDHGDIREANKIFDELLTRSPKNPSVLNMKGVIDLHLGKLASAQSHLRKAIQISPDKPDYHRNLGAVYKRMGRMEAAEKCLQRGISLTSNDHRLYYELGELLQVANKTEEARRSYFHCLHLKPNFAEAYNNLGLIALKQDQKAHAQQLFCKALAINNNLGAALANIGYLYKLSGEYEKALSFLHRAKTISPNNAALYGHIGEIYQWTGLRNEALESFRKMAAIQPQKPTGWINLGTAYQSIDEPDKAMACYQVALRLDRNIPQAYLNIGIAYRKKKRFRQALDCFYKALKLNPNYENALAQLVHLLMSLCMWEDLKQYAARLDKKTSYKLSIQRRPYETPFLSIARHQNPQRNFDIAKCWSRKIERNAHENSFANSPRKRSTCRKITLGYLCANFRNHTTADLILGLLKGHDRERFSIIGYSYGQTDDSFQKRLISNACDRFREIGSLSDYEAASVIHSDGTEILIDLMGHTADSRLGICAFRPAPIQVRMLGMAGTTGATFFDYIVTDPVVTPPELQPYYTEKFILMPHCYQVNNYSDVPLPATGERERRGVVLGCFSTAYKIDPVAFDAWMEILNQVPNCELWLMSENNIVRSNLKSYAAARGISHSRIRIMEKLPKQEHLKRLAQVDLVLDTITVNGAATTSDALWMGVPVLTLQGRHFASRMASSLLRAIGMPDLVTTGLHEYITKAVTLAKDRDRLEHIKARLKRHRTVYSLFDTQQYVDDFEVALVEISGRFRDGQKPTQLMLQAAE